FEIAEAEAPVGLRRGDPMQAERSHFRPEIARKKVVAVDGRSARRDFLLGEAFGAVADHFGALAEVEVERSWGVGDHRLRRVRGKLDGRSAGSSASRSGARRLFRARIEAFQKLRRHSRASRDSATSFVPSRATGFTHSD